MRPCLRLTLIADRVTKELHGVRLGAKRRNIIGNGEGRTKSRRPKPQPPPRL